MMTSKALLVRNKYLFEWKNTDTINNLIDRYIPTLNHLKTFEPLTKENFS